MSVEATSSDARKAAVRELSENKIQERQERLAEAMDEAETKKQAMRARAAEDAVTVDILSTRK